MVQKFTVKDYMAQIKEDSSVASLGVIPMAPVAPPKEEKKKKNAQVLNNLVNRARKKHRKETQEEDFDGLKKTRLSYEGSGVSMFSEEPKKGTVKVEISDQGSENENISLAKRKVHDRLKAILGTDIIYINDLKRL